MKTLTILTAFAALGLSASAASASQPSMGSWDPAVGRQATGALNLLEAKGYGAFRHFQAQGADFTATVKQQNRTVTLLIDPGAGTIQAEN
jgi:hypothetical protein